MQPSMQVAGQVMRPELQASRPVPMQVSLAFVEQRVNVWLRFGKPARETVLNRWRRVAVFEPGAVCCRVKWIANDYGTALWQLTVLQAPKSFDGAQRIAGVLPGARILLRADGEQQVKAVLAVIDAMKRLGIDPCAVALTCWGAVGNCLAARQPLPEYTAEWHAAHIARGALQ
ncbi:MAG: transposase [Burkholderiales bacterium RIFOXYD12_FULL_59_19]|nr:MAG: transposase [Burkholderiales bacterium RIFOXYD12_FULL_59_19]